MPYAKVNGQKLYYEDAGGDGTPVVLSHGYLMDHQMFHQQVEALKERYRVITWDQRSHGETESTLDPADFWDFAEDLAGLLDHLGIERAVLGGVSQGGFLSLRFALKHPDRVLGLILIDTQGGLEDDEKVPQYDALLNVWTTDGPNDDIANVVAMLILGAGWEGSPTWIEKWRQVPNDRMIHMYRTLMDRDDILDRLPEIQVPTVVIHGEDDIAIDMEKAERLAAGLPNATGPVRIPGAGHASNLTHPEPVNEAIEAFLAANAAGGI